MGNDVAPGTKPNTLKPLRVGFCLLDIAAPPPPPPPPPKQPDATSKPEATNEPKENSIGCGSIAAA
jgi:hypothetical protein